MMQIDSSRQNLLVAQAQIGKTLERRVAEFEALPKTAAGRFLREMGHSGYLASKDRQVAEMQEYYDLYLQSTKLLAASYAICGNMKTAEETFSGRGTEMVRTVNKNTLNDKITKLEKAMSRNRQQYDKMADEMKRLLDMRKAIQSDELYKAYTVSKRSFEEIMCYIQSDPESEECDA